MQCILSELMGGNSSENIVVNGSSLLVIFSFCKDLNFITINYKFTIQDHPTLHFCISSECSTWCQLKLKIPVKLTSMVSIFTSGTAGRGCSLSFLHSKYPLIMLCGFIEELDGGIFLPALVRLIDWLDRVWRRIGYISAM